MQLLLADRLRPQRSIGSAVVSACLHAGLIVVLAVSGQRVVATVSGLIQQTVQFLYPAPRDIGLARPGERLDASGTDARAFGAGAPHAAAGEKATGFAVNRARSGIEYAPIPLDGESTLPGTGEGVFSAVDVDTAAAVDPTSVAPDYPAALVARHIEGGARFRFEVDSAGHIDMATVRQLSATHPLFAKAVRDAMPQMHFFPGRVGNLAVRQLVEQAFSFKIQKVKTTIG